MFVLFGSVAFSKMGYLRAWIELSSGYIPEHSTAWISGGYKKVGLPLSKSDGENGEGEDDADDDHLPKIPEKKEATDNKDEDAGEEGDADKDEDAAKFFFYF